MKRLITVVLASAIIFIFPFTAYAHNGSNGFEDLRAAWLPPDMYKTQPDEYVLDIAFSICGVNLYTGLPDLKDAYFSWLESSHSENRSDIIRSLSSLSWGKNTYDDMDMLVQSVKEWLSLSPDYGGNSLFYSMPYSPDYPFKKSQYVFSEVQTEPYKDVGLVQSNSTQRFSYVFSASGYCSEGHLLKVNFSYASASGYPVLVERPAPASYFFKNNSYGVSINLSNFYDCFSEFDNNGILIGSGKNVSAASAYAFKPCAVGQLPHYIFLNKTAHDNYYNSGVKGDMFIPGYLPVFLSSVKPEVQKMDAVNVKGSLDMSSYKDCYAGLLSVYRSANISGLKTNLKSLGLDVDWGKSYTIEHYKDGTMIDSVLSFSSLFSEYIVSDVDVFPPPGYKVDMDTSTPLPFTLDGENNVIKVCYIIDETSPVTIVKHGVDNTMSGIISVVKPLVPFALPIAGVGLITPWFIKWLRCLFGKC